MTDQQLDKFKKEIYEPYKQAWDIIGSLRTKDLSQQTTWDEWYAQCQQFYVSHSNEYCHSLYRVIIDAGDAAMKVWKG